MELKDFNYELPQELIAQDPLPDRSQSRLMVLDKTTGEVEHHHFTEILNWLNPGDALVLNDTRVIPARLLGQKEGTGGKMEFVLLNRVEGDVWEVLVKPGKRAMPGTRFQFGNGILSAEVLSIVEGGNRHVRFEYTGIFEEVLDKVGIIPLPPYITHHLDNPERYQTVYSRERGSAAAPTAGLHFTKPLLESIRSKGVHLVYVTLHVGLGTFRPVKEQNILEHKMHSEYYHLSEEAAGIINNTKRAGGKIVSVGTTSCRVLETIAQENGQVLAGSGWTNIFIYPGYRFKAVDALITNFHLPQSTLLMLVSALAGREHILAAYQEAIRERYRFFSFGDAMLIV